MVDTNVNRSSRTRWRCGALQTILQQLCSIQTGSLIGGIAVGNIIGEFVPRLEQQHHLQRLLLRQWHEMYG